MAEEKDLLEIIADEVHPEKYKPLVKKHAEAHKKALGAVEETAGLKFDQIIDALADYHIKYAVNVGELTETQAKDSYVRHKFRGQAIDLLEGAARQRKMSLDDFVDSLEREGISDLLNSIHQSKMQGDIESWKRSVYHKHVDFYDADAKERLAASLKAADKTLKHKSKRNILHNLEPYVLGHVGERYDKASPSEYEQKKAA